MVQNAFRRLEFARPSVRIQPEGTVTLVNLPTYYRVEWPSAGVQPTEVATVTMLGLQVRIRPRAQSYTYAFGDGTSTAPTPDAGGRYPRGGIVHTYRGEGSVPASVTARYTADFSVAGGPWQPVGDTVAVRGPATTLDVREATARLRASTAR